VRNAIVFRAGRLIQETRVVDGSTTTYDLTYTYDQLGNRQTKIDTVSGQWVVYDYDVDLADPNELEFPTWHNRLLEYRMYDRDPNDPNTILLRTVSYTYYKTGQASNITVKDEDPNGTGDLEEIDYSDSTPDVDFSYSRDGQYDEITDAVGTRTFTYDSYGKRQYETFDPNDIFGNKQITTDYSYQVGYGDPVGMPPSQPLFSFRGLANIGISPSGTSYQDYRAEYSYDNETQRVEKVSRHVVTNDGVEYTYRSDAHLIDHYDFKSGANVLASVHYSYESDRDLITEVRNIWGDDPNDPNNIVSKYTYAYDNLGRASSVVRQGDASFGAFANDHYDAYSYNNRNERTKARRYNNTSPPSTTNEDSSYHRQFVFDNAGNWDWFKPGSDPNTPYIPNALNLYASINDPSDPETPTESFTYDEDENLTEDGSFEYTYDAENRLVEVLPAEDDPNNLTADDRKLVSTYDYLNRRVRKLVYAWDPNEGESGDWSSTAELDLRFIYHERLLLLELDGLDSNAKVRKHVWGPGTDGRPGGPPFARRRMKAPFV